MSFSTLPPGPLADEKRKYGADDALTAVSGAALGALCSYVREFGTPYQRERCGRVIDSILELQCQATTAKGAPVEPDWFHLRQELYELAGDWLWTHACHHFRTAVAPKMCIPPGLREEALRVGTPIEYSAQLRGEEHVSRGYVSFGLFKFGGSDEYFEEKPSEADGGAGLVLPVVAGELGQEEGEALPDAVAVDDGKKRPKDQFTCSKRSNYVGLFRKKGDRNWGAQVRMRCNKNFFCGRFDTEEEAGFAVDVMQAFFYPPEGNDKSHHRKLNVATYELCEEIWRPHLEQLGKYRRANTIDTKERPAFRPIIRSAVNDWMESRRKGTKRLLDNEFEDSTVNKSIADDAAGDVVATELEPGKAIPVDG